MKKLLLVAFVGLFALGMTSCKKDNLANTKWVCDQLITLNVEGFDVNVDFDGTLEFTSKTEGTMDMAAVITIPGFGSIPSGNSHTAFTYTFDGEHGVMTNLPDEENPEVSDIEFTVQGNTLTIVEADDELGEITLNFIKQ